MSSNSSENRPAENDTRKSTPESQPNSGSVEDATIISDIAAESAAEAEEIDSQEATRKTARHAASPPKPDVPQFAPGTEISNRYRIVALLGRGGMGEVYRADDLVLEQTVALKFLPPETTRDPTAIARFRQEARLARKVTHSNVCRVHDIGEWNGSHFLSMAFIDGEDLSSLLRREGKLPRQTALAICRQMAAGLAAAHAQGVLHRDLKPGNMLIDANGHVMITDFGLALQSEQGASLKSSAGTVPYMAPEQITGEGITERSDLYALGLVFHDVFTANRVFRAEPNVDLLKLRRKTVQLMPILDAALDPDIREIIERCLQPDPALRPESASIVHQQLMLLDAPHVAGAAPPVPTNNLPQQLTSFVGRERVLADLKRLVFETRLLMLLGPGGAGKTRLSVQVAQELLPEFPGGVWWVELAPLSDPSLVVQSVASALGIREAGSRPLLETLTEELRQRRLLLILDNCEHLVGACAVLANALLRKCPELRILASSRERLGIDGELPYRVPSLTLPQPDQVVTADEARNYEAVALFAERASAASSRFGLTDQNANTVVRICRRLDGIPLALELAAARTRSLAVDDLERRLDQCFRILTGGNRAALPRQQTLRALIDWSYDLLTVPEKKLLARLSVFSGGFTYEMAEQVCTGDEVEDFDMLDLLTSLTDKSLVVADTVRETTRYSLLETVRQYARDRLDESGEARPYQLRHLKSMLQFTAEAAKNIEGEKAARWADRYETEHDNIRAAMDFSLLSPETSSEALQIAINTWGFWYQRGYYRELSARMPAALAATEGLGGIELRATGLVAAGNANLMRGDYQEACRQFEEALEIRRKLGTPQPIWNALFNYGNALNLVGNLSAARACLEEALKMSESMPKTIAGSHCNLGETLALLGDFSGARQHLETALAGFRGAGITAAVAEITGFLGRICQQEGRLDEAESLYRDALETLRADRFVGFGYFVGPYCFAGLALARNDLPRAARLYGAHAAVRERLGSPLPPVFRTECEQAENRLRTELGEAAFAAEWNWGRRLNDRQAIEYALDEWDGSTSEIVGMQTTGGN